MAKELTWHQAINRVLGSSAMPLHYVEITERIIADGLRASLGATPSATVSAQIAMSIKKKGANSPYLRVGRGIYTLAKSLPTPEAVTSQHKPTRTTQPSDDSEEEYDIVTSFGVYWRRNSTDWVATPKLLGMQQLGATPVDFNKQVGIYLLLDGREVIYIGRATERPLGRRLYEHTRDRMAVRWDRFSWFGLLPVAENGKLGVLPEIYHAAKVIPAFEALLIEALEPRQNRKRGDDLSAVEYIQHEDPAIHKKRMKEDLSNAIDKL